MLCGIEDLSQEVLGALASSVGAGKEVEPLGEVLAAVLGLWRHDQLLDAQQSATLGTVIVAAVDRLLWLVESAPGTPGAPAQPRRIAAVRAVRDAVRHAAARLGLDSVRALEVMARIADNAEAAPDLRGAAFGFGWSLGTPPPDAERTIRAAGSPASLGDWLGGLFALAREQCLEETSVLPVLDDLVTAMTDRDLLVALPALRQAFGYFPPRERETIAGQVLRLHGVEDSARSLVRARDRRSGGPGAGTGAGQPCAGGAGAGGADPVSDVSQDPETVRGVGAVAADPRRPGLRGHGAERRERLARRGAGLAVRPG